MLCGLVWNKNEFAYRCNTCALNSGMALCIKCFENGNHDKHDFNMFRSFEGGVCDCGDLDALKKNGFCKFHGNDSYSVPEAPIDMTKCCEIMLSNLIYRILQHFRTLYLQGKSVLFHLNYLNI